MRTLHEGKDQNKKSTAVAVKQRKPLPKKRVECMPIMFQTSDEEDDGEFMGFTLEEVREVGIMITNSYHFDCDCNIRCGCCTAL